jgi:hypothetical protein
MSDGPKTYDISTIDDLAKVANSDNVGRLITDLYGWLLTVILARHLAESDGVNLDDNFKCVNFHWIDDGKHNIHTEIVDHE